MSAGYEIAAMPNAHSHAFQRDLRGIAERPAPAAHARDDFWSWREAMFGLAAALDPASMRTVAEAVFGEMRAAGYGTVGEFHYVHHRPDGAPYEDPNILAIAVAEAAQAAGLEIVLLPAAYHRNGWDGGDRPPHGGQLRFCDPSAAAFLERVDALRAWADGRQGVRVGVAAHSVRAVPSGWLEAIAAYAEEHRLVRHVHASEQRRELAECEAEHGCSPIELLHRTGFLGPRTSVIHAIHVSSADVARLAASGTIVVTCPTTEGNLGDGYLPALAYRDAGVRLAIGSDSQARVDPFEELRELETLARREQQGRHGLLAAAGDLWAQVAAAGRASLGIEDDARTITIDRGHPQIAGVPEADVARALVASASAAVVAAPAAPAASAAPAAPGAPAGPAAPEARAARRHP